ncbi:MAG: DUF3526 domain-containing protein [Pseudomonadota bacterium]
MSRPSALMREASLLRRDRGFLTWVCVVLALAAIAVISGLNEVAHQRATLAKLLDADREDREVALAKQSDWGSAAYYSFHLTYDPPSEFAFAALGRRDQDPWKHRVRMLALEGQIYERDVGNPVLALIGRFDYAFFAAFVLPIVLIVLLHDLHASERSAGRHGLLVTTAGKTSRPWRMRALLRSAAVFFAAVLPLLVVSLNTGVSLLTTTIAVSALLSYVGLWTVLCTWIASKERSAEVLLAFSLGIWMLVAVILPAGAKVTIDRLAPVPSGADITLTQREAVNDAWDLPKATTMDAFIKRHPEWTEYTEMSRPFEWKWYYAFQQVGDQSTEALSGAYRQGRIERDRLAAIAAWLSPPALLERVFQRLANTDIKASLVYEAEVRSFHAQLRAFFYQKMFRERPYDKAALESLPEFAPSGTTL